MKILDYSNCYIFMQHMPNFILFGKLYAFLIFKSLLDLVERKSGCPAESAGSIPLLHTGLKIIDCRRENEKLCIQVFVEVR